MSSNKKSKQKQKLQQSPITNPYTKNWVEFQNTSLESGGEWCYMVDMSFLLSGYKCVFGKPAGEPHSCKGTTGHPEIGCCSIGVLVSNEEKPALEARIAALTAEDWQFIDVDRTTAPLIHKRPEVYGHQWNTRVYKTQGAKACIFANRSSFSAGAGCAFHTHALRVGESPIDWKPDACWMQPLTMDYDWARMICFVRQSTDEDWYGTRDSANWKWFCSHDDTAFSNAEPVFRTQREELRRMLSNDEVFDRIIAECEYRWLRLPSTAMNTPLSGSDSTWVPVTLTQRYGPTGR
jgi:hypothetical protein